MQASAAGKTGCQTAYIATMHVCYGAMHGASNYGQVAPRPKVRNGLARGERTDLHVPVGQRGAQKRCEDRFTENGTRLIAQEAIARRPRRLPSVGPRRAPGGEVPCLGVHTTHRRASSSSSCGSQCSFRVERSVSRAPVLWFRAGTPFEPFLGRGASISGLRAPSCSDPGAPDQAIDVYTASRCTSVPCCSVASIVYDVMFVTGAR